VGPCRCQRPRDQGRFSSAGLQTRSRLLQRLRLEPAGREDPTRAGFAHEPSATIRPRTFSSSASAVWGFWAGVRSSNYRSCQPAFLPGPVGAVARFPGRPQEKRRRRSRGTSTGRSSAARHRTGRDPATSATSNGLVPLGRVETFVQSQQPPDDHGKPAQKTACCGADRADGDQRGLPPSFERRRPAGPG